MPATKVKKFLDLNGIKYVTIRHSPAYSAQEVAESAHVSGRFFAKTVIVVMDDQMAMVVVPACQRVYLPDLREMLENRHVRLAHEEEFRTVFPDCELGAMPPFGNLYRLPVYVAETVAQEPEIAFNAGSHTEVIRMDYNDFEELVRPVVLAYITV